MINLKTYNKWLSILSVIMFVIILINHFSRNNSEILKDILISLFTGFFATFVIGILTYYIEKDNKYSVILDKMCYFLQEIDFIKKDVTQLLECDKKESKLNEYSKKSSISRLEILRSNLNTFKSDFILIDVLTPKSIEEFVSHINVCEMSANGLVSIIELDSITDKSFQAIIKTMDNELNKGIKYLILNYCKGKKKREQNVKLLSQNHLVHIEL